MLPAAFRRLAKTQKTSNSILCRPLIPNAICSHIFQFCMNFYECLQHTEITQPADENERRGNHVGPPNFCER